MLYLEGFVIPPAPVEQKLNLNTDIQVKLFFLTASHKAQLFYEMLIFLVFTRT